MSFLFPLYLAGAAAIALPIYLHLRRRPPKDAVDFSSLMFLEPSKHQPLKRRSRLEHILLLVLRCLALLFLAIMFSRPFFSGGEDGDGVGQGRTVILLDVSASMKRGEQWQEAVRITEDKVSEMRPDGSLAIIAIDQVPRTIVSFDDWRSVDAPRRAKLMTS